jgi:hypothetical protein
MKDVEQAFADLEAFLARFDPLEFLSQLSMTHLFTPRGQFASELDEVHVWARHIEFATGYYATRPLPISKRERVDGFVLEDFKSLMDTYFSSANIQLATQSIDPRMKHLPSALTSAKTHSLHVRGDAYPHQFWEYAKAIYSPHDDWFLRNLGFTIGDALTLIESLTRELNLRYQSRRDSSLEEATSLVREGRADWTALGITEADALSRAQVHQFFGQAKELYRFDNAQLVTASGLPVERCAACLTRLSQQPPYRNPMFPNSFMHGSSALWDYNTLSERPLLTDGEGFWLISQYSFVETLYSTFYFDLMADKEYKPSFEASRARVLEEKVAEYLCRIFPRSSVHLNPAYPNGEEFADVCVIFDGKILIVQCKGKKLTRAAHIGADEKALRTDIEKAIRHAVEQAAKGRTFLEKTDEPYLLISGQKVPVHKSAFNEIDLVAVTYMPLHSIATRIREVEEDLGLEHSRYPAWALALGDLDLVTQVCSSPAKLLHYLRRRLTFEDEGKHIRGDEKDLLGFYLDQGLWLKGDEFEGMDFVGISGFSDPIDEYVHRKYACDESIQVPQVRRTDGFYQIIETIESLPTEHRTDCAMSLLDLSGRAGERFVEAVRKAKELTRLDGKTHTCSFTDNNTIPGISFVTASRTADAAEFVHRTQAFGHLKKYAEQNDRWVALGWKEGSDQPVDIALWLEFPFVPDEQMDLAVAAVLPSGVQKHRPV